MKQQLSKFCHFWLPAGSVMLCSLTMLMAAPLLPDAPTAVAQSVQTNQVTGMVTDKQKEPLIGVTVTLVGTEIRAITDADGMFRINVPVKSGTTLEFNYIGFASKQVKVNGARLLNVMLEEEANQ